MKAKTFLNHARANLSLYSVTKTEFDDHTTYIVRYGQYRVIINEYEGEFEYYSSGNEIIAGLLIEHDVEHAEALEEI